MNRHTSMHVTYNVQYTHYGHTRANRWPAWLASVLQNIPTQQMTEMQWFSLKAGGGYDSGIFIDSESVFGNHME